MPELLPQRPIGMGAILVRVVEVNKRRVAFMRWRIGVLMKVMGEVLSPCEASQLPTLGWPL